MTARRLWWTAAVLAVAIAVGFAWYEGTRPEQVDDTVGNVARVGASDGDVVAEYVRSAKTELSELDSEVYALVSLSDYTGPERLSSMFAGVTVRRVYARVPLPDTQTEIVSIAVSNVDTDVASGMRLVADRKDTEASRFAAGSRSAQVSQAEAAAYRSGCACVYGVVVRGASHALRELASRAGVWVVDAAPEVKRLDRAVFLPLRPESTTVVAPPPDSGVSTP